MSDDTRRMWEHVHMFWAIVIVSGIIGVFGWSLHKGRQDTLARCRLVVGLARTAGDSTKAVECLMLVQRRSRP